MCQSDIFTRLRRSLPAAPFSIFFSFLLTVILFLSSCEESSFIGLEVQPQSDRFRIMSYQDDMISTSVETADSVVSVGQSRSLLGVHDDPLFGRLSASFVTQVGIAGTIDFGDEPVADSMILYLVYTGVHGGETGPQEITVYEITEMIDFETNYYSNVDPANFAPEADVLARHTFSPQEGDTLIRIPVTSTRFHDKLVNAPDSATQSLGQFISYFKGLYVKAEQLEGNGSVYSINLNNTNSKLSLFYRNAEPDTSFRYDYIINEGANRVNLFSHDYSEAAFTREPGQTGDEDTVYYLQGAAGAMGRLDFDHLHTWRDSMPVSINSAKIYLPVEETTTSDGKYPVPARISLLQKDINGNLLGVIDLGLGESYFGGAYNAEQGYYSANITNWVQSVVRGDNADNSLYVAVRQSAITPNRAVLRSGDHPSGGPRLEIMYTRH